MAGKLPGFVTVIDRGCIVVSEPKDQLTERWKQVTFGFAKTRLRRHLMERT